MFLVQKACHRQYQEGRASLSMSEEMAQRFDVEVVQVNVTVTNVEIVVPHLFSVGRRTNA